jgi:hypothetical protein
MFMVITATFNNVSIIARSSSSTDISIGGINDNALAAETNNEILKTKYI